MGISNQNSQNTKRKLVSPLEVAELLAISVSTLAVWRCRGYGVPYIKVGRKVMYDLLSVYEWIDNQTRI